MKIRLRSRGPSGIDVFLLARFADSLKRLRSNSSSTSSASISTSATCFAIYPKWKAHQMGLIVFLFFLFLVSSFSSSLPRYFTSLNWYSERSLMKCDVKHFRLNESTLVWCVILYQSFWNQLLKFVQFWKLSCEFKIMVLKIFELILSLLTFPEILLN